MSLVFKTSDEKVQRLQAKVSILEAEISEVRAELDFDQDMLDLFEEYRWDIGLKKLAEPRARYLAAEGMKISPDAKDQYWMARGQYEEAMKLCRIKEELVADIDARLAELEQKGVALARVQSELGKLKE